MNTKLLLIGFYSKQNSDDIGNDGIGNDDIGNDINHPIHSIHTPVIESSNTKTNLNEKYPPRREEILEKMISYMHSNKRYSIQSCTPFKIEKVPTKIITKETECFYCECILSSLI